VAATGHVCVSVDGGSVRVGRRTTFEGGIVSTEIDCRPGATVEIGEDCVLNYGATIKAARSVTIGARTLIASFVVISDQTREKSAPIVIGDDVWIAHGAVIEPGVTIGAGSTVSAKSVVTRDVPPDSLVIGNPARAMSLALVAPR
jgi:acetyltransferase-like isoleucine patch superfamily enzyme